MSGSIESRTKSALKQFDSNMGGIFDRASFYDQDLYSQSAYPQLTKSQLCFKYTLFLANLIFFIFGAVLCSVGGYASNNQIAALAGTTLATGILVLGIFIILLSFLGAFAAWRESRFFLIIYFVFLLLFTIILFFVGIAVYVEKDQSASLITTGWQTAPPDLRNSLEIVFDCCGLTIVPNVTFNPSLCPSGVTLQPCLDQFQSTFNSYYVQAGSCGIAFAVVMLFGMLFVCFLMDGIKRKRQEQDIAKLRANHNETENEQLEISTSTRQKQEEGEPETQQEEEEAEEEEEN